MALPALARPLEVAARCAGVAAVVVHLGCGSDPAESERASASSDAGSRVETSAAGGMTVIPAAEGPYDEMWAPLRNLDRLIQPLATGSAEKMLEALREGGGSAPADTVEPQPMIIAERGPRGETLRIVLYTDPGLVKAGTYTIDRPVADALESALYTEQVQGASFNPYTRVSNDQVFSYSVDKLYLAGLIGYLTAPEVEPGHHGEAANAARNAGKPYEALYHALRSLSEKEDWTRSELAKLWATWELDFPGARDMAMEELTWFIREGHDTPEAKTLLARFRSATES